GRGGGFRGRVVGAAAGRATGEKIPQVMGPRREGDPPVLVAAIDRAAEVLGWRPRRSTLEEMVGSAWMWNRVRAVESRIERATDSD
ncbi:MAG: hypothetical protein AB1736_10305, partial [Chloroflexota bacterium]